MSFTSDNPLSVLVMTFNEEDHIERCLNSVAGIGGEIFILDSYSTDKTVEKALHLGARVEQHPFDTYAEQRRRMIRLAKYDWILILDADEYLSQELRASILEVVKERNCDAYTSNRRNKIGNSWLRHGSWYPDRKIRMFDRNKVLVEGYDVHEILKPVSGARIGHLKGDLMHLANENITERFQKIALYSTRSAEGLYKRGQQTNWWKILFKPPIRFISVYIIRLGFLDGFYGYVVAKSEANYVWLREVKLKELNQKVKGKR